MKVLNFAVKMKIDIFYKSQQQEILSISAADENLGFICVNKFAPGDVSRDDTFTPFTSFGTLGDEDCIACALSVLFSVRTSINPEYIDIAESDSSPTGAILSALISSARNSGRKNTH